MKIVVVGAGEKGHAGVVVDNIVHSGKYEMVGFLDDNIKLKGKEILGFPVLGSSKDLETISKEVEGFFVAIGNNSARVKIFNRLKESRLKPVNIIHPSAIISEGVRMGDCVFIGPKVVVNNGCTIGNCVIINTAASIDHDNTIEDGAHIAPNVATGGRVTIRESSFIGIGTSVIEGITIGDHTIVGAGASVVKDIPPNSKYGGVPAKPIGISEEGKSKWTG